MRGHKILVAEIWGSQFYQHKLFVNLGPPFQRKCQPPKAIWDRLCSKSLILSCKRKYPDTAGDHCSQLVVATLVPSTPMLIFQYS